MALIPLIRVFNGTHPPHPSLLQEGPTNTHHTKNIFRFLPCTPPCWLLCHSVLRLRPAGLIARLSRASGNLTPWTSTPCPGPHNRISRDIQSISCRDIRSISRDIRSISRDIPKPHLSESYISVHASMSENYDTQVGHRL